ncbi:MAG: radical SAM family heme chaperone HemW, partial [Pseudomonadota bacterium]
MARNRPGALPIELPSRAAPPERMRPGPGNAWQEGDLAVYVHWPFCAAKCPYCDFNSHVRAHVDEARWQAALLSDLDHALAEAAPRQITSVFFGGGTPSLMPPATVAAILDRLAARARLATALEVTLEANPTSVERARFETLRGAGVNRVSVGLQALDDAALHFLGRQHTAAEGLAALEAARRIFPRVSFDLIYARPEQTRAAWESELKRALDLGADHFSLYQLTIEPGTLFEKMVDHGQFVPLKDDLATELYFGTEDLCAGFGLGRYEVSNFARPGAECRHNLAYWQYRPYIGVGPGAHGRRVREGQVLAVTSEPRPEHWLQRVDRFGHGRQAPEPLIAQEVGDEVMLMGLRLAEGLDLDWLARLTGGLTINANDIDALVRGGLVRLEGRRLRATNEGLPLLDWVLSNLRVKAMKDKSPAHAGDAPVSQ